MSNDKKAPATRLYKVTNRESGQERIVQAISQAQALGYVARTDWSVDVLTTPDAFRLAREGVVEEIASAGEVAPAQVDAFATVGSADPSADPSAFG